jgi:hypothetical protein
MGHGVKANEIIDENKQDKELMKYRTALFRFKLNDENGFRRIEMYIETMEEIV